MISLMYAERAKAVASEGRATHGTDVGADIRGWRQPDVMEAVRRDGGSQTRWRQPDAMEAGSKEVGDFAIWQNLRLF
ncbi:MAG: hypothetical protein SPF58_01530 [Candidatus Cryptobacteroides sp.]|uniref:hypothetical protein n=1 Tax=Candidatus Cryptobacteroides sp. TaxID=2952915 RepID=UPI002A908EEC|nr:hypothetical protein [Candidatus Cryptobacteroides sp.]MDY5565950.1 hypothetical protein [Candidatus Cryptobacteroides sp.]